MPVPPTSPFFTDTLPADANGFSEVNARLGVLWRELPEEEKAPLQTRAAADKKDKEAALQEWKEAHPKEATVRTATAFNVGGACRPAYRWWPRVYACMHAWPLHDPRRLYSF